MSEFKSYQVEMAVDEACNQVLAQATSTSTDRQPHAKEGFIVSFREVEKGVEVQIVDFGPGWGIPIPPEGELDPHRAREQDDSLGLYIIHQLVDAIDYQRDPDGGNRLRLTKRL